jgi:hypothetical protein
VNHVAALVLCLAGFTLLALATERQQRVLNRPLSRLTQSGLRIAAICALLLALGLLVAWQGWGFGLVMFSGHTSLAAGLVYCGLIAYARRPA